MEALKLSELKELCQRRGLPVSGSKPELIQRLIGGSSQASSGSSTVARATTTTTSSATFKSSSESMSISLFPNDYDVLTIPQLKDLCRERVLPVGGIKDDLVARLKASDPRNMTLTTLKDKCRDVALPVTGTKADLVDRVMKSMSSGTTAVLQTKSVEELKDLCRERGVAVGGKKDELIERLKQAWTSSSSSSSSTATSASKTVGKAVAEKSSTTGAVAKKTKAKPIAAAPSYESMTIPQLKEICREKKLMLGGTKDELIERLNKASTTSISRPLSASKTSSSTSSSLPTTATSTTSITSSGGYEAMMVPQLKELCRSRTLPLMGTKDELIKRLEEHDGVVRMMFKKRKSPSSDSIPLVTTPAPALSTGKRKVGYDDPAAKKTKTAAHKSVVTDVTKPPTAKNVSAFAVPPVATPAARKSTPSKARKKVATEQSEGRYLVYSTCAYPRDGFHSYAGPGEPKYYGRCATKEDANDRVNTLFYHNNPWGLDADEMDANLDISEDWKGGLLRLEVCPPDSEQWVVGVKETGDAADDDGDVIMVSGSDTEDEYGYAY